MEENISQASFDTTKSITGSKVSQNLVPIFIAVLTIWYLQSLWRNRKLYMHSWNIPGPLSLPIIGAAYLFIGNSNIMTILINVQKKFPDLSKVWFGNRLIYFVSSPQHIEKILNHPKSLGKDHHYRFISYVIGTGLMTAPVVKWRKHRKTIMPSFNQKILDLFVTVFARKSRILIGELKSYVGKKDINLFLLFSRCTLDIICETAMGVDMKLQNSDCDFGTNLDRIMEITTLRIFRVWHHLDFTWKLHQLNREYAKCIRKFHNLTSSVVRKKMLKYKEKQLKTSESVLAEIEDESPKKFKPFLDLILENSNFTEEELREEVDIFIIAGTDTTAASLCCLFTILGMFQDIQQKVYEEIIDILGPDRDVQPSDLPEMKYTERVIKETLRIIPVPAFFLRAIGEDIDLGDAVLPAGSSAFFGLVHIHRNPKYWPDPLKFDPDRFLPENIAKRHPCTYIPFSLGPRNCIGMRYAMMNLKTVLSTVIRKYRIFTEYKSVEEIELKCNIVIRMKDGPKAWIELR